MGFTEAVQSGFRKFAVFEGRASRSEYWWWALFAFLVQLLLAIADVVAGDTGLLPLASAVVLLLSGLAVTVRRLHDTDHSAWNLLWSLVLILGGLYLLYLYVRPGDAGPNRYGPPPSSPSPSPYAAL